MSKEQTAHTILCGCCFQKGRMDIVSQANYSWEKLYQYEPDFCDTHRDDYEIRILKCPNCQEINILRRCIRSTEYPDGDFPSEPEYLYPISEELKPSYRMPKKLQEAYNDAIFCLKNKRASLCIAQCRTVLDLLSKEFSSSSLEGNLGSMKKQGWLDQNSYDWALSVKDFGNDAVHANPVKDFTQEDAQDIFDLTSALLEYFFDLMPRFADLSRRRGKKLSEEEEDHLSEPIFDTSEVSILQNALASNHECVRLYTAYTLVKNGFFEDEIIYILLSFLDKKYKQDIISILGKIPSEYAPKLSDWLNRNRDGSEDLKKKRIEVISLLGEMANTSEEVISTLVTELQDSDTQVRDSAFFSLKKLGIDAAHSFTKIYR